MIDVHFDSIVHVRVCIVLPSDARSLDHKQF